MMAVEFNHAWVPGTGPPDADGMIVGEAPGFEEMRQGRPFVGHSGVLLDGVLATLGLRREDLYITNVVKVIPLDEDGKIERPRMKDIGTWSSFLALEIQNVAPVAILCLGRTAVDHLMPEGIEFGKREGEYFSAWHPAHVLRNEELAEEWLHQIIPWAEEIHDAET
jgi:DNA polymerase